MKKTVFTIILAVIVLFGAGQVFGKTISLLNVSYDPTRELYKEYNDAFAAFWKEKTGDTVVVLQSHGGSGSQARAVIDGLEADVVTLALAYDIDAIAEHAKLLPKEWQMRLPHNSAPYTSTLIFLVRKGNPKGIRSWEDLVRPGVQVITPNPKTSGAARWNYLAAWGYALKRELGGDYIKKLNDPAFADEVAAAQAAARQFVGALYKNELDAAGVESVYPEVSILAETTVAVVDKIADRKGTQQVAQAYLEYLYSPEGQNIAGKNYYRPTSPEAIEKYKHQFPAIELFTIDEVFGGWAKANAVHFADGGEFDKIYVPKGN